MSNNRGQAFHRSVEHKLPDGNCGAWFATEKKAESDAENASAELARRTLKLFWKWEVRHGFQAGAGKLLVPAGYIPEDAQCSR